MKTVTVVAPINMAVIKYWGKRDEDLILPINDSISATLSTDFMCAKTTIQASPSFTENRIWLNGQEIKFDNPRLVRCLKEVKKRAHPNSPILKWNIAICSVNNFPTAAGLASSAAGYSCLVYALAKLYDIESDVSDIARQGSGSACRSMFGGWVQWCKGTSLTGVDSKALQIAPVSHWPEMRVVVLVVNDGRKKHSSTDAMRRSVETSELLLYRAEIIVPKRIEMISEAILKKDFETFARITMEDSNQFHAICLDTYPPCAYMNDTSHHIVEIVHMYNKYKSANKVAYTFDAGPNASIYLLESELEEFMSVVNYVFPPTSNDAGYFRGLQINATPIKEELRTLFAPLRQKVGAFKFVILTKLGDGPKVLKDEKEQLLTASGLPKDL